MRTYRVFGRDGTVKDYQADSPGAAKRAAEADGIDVVRMQPVTDSPDDKRERQ